MILASCSLAPSQVVSSSPATPAPTPAASSSPAPPSLVGQACVPTDQDQYVYNPARLVVLAPCIRVTGTVEAVRLEDDGDLHVLLALDAPFVDLLRPTNQGEELGDLVVEPVCVRAVTQADAIDTCAADPDPLRGPFPDVGNHIWMEGRYVLDSEHGDWAELHPLYRWGPYGGPTTTSGPAATAAPSVPSTAGGYYKPPGWDGHSDVDCADFDTHANAQSFFIGTGGSRTNDPYRLDGDNDGIACEALP